jgi:hypothetical protein
MVAMEDLDKENRDLDEQSSIYKRSNAPRSNYASDMSPIKMRDSISSRPVDMPPLDLQNDK